MVDVSVAVVVCQLCITAMPPGCAVFWWQYCALLQYCFCRRRCRLGACVGVHRCSGGGGLACGGCGWVLTDTHTPLLCTLRLLCGAVWVAETTHTAPGGTTLGARSPHTPAVRHELRRLSPSALSARTRRRRRLAITPASARNSHRVLADGDLRCARRRYWLFWERRGEGL